MILITKLKDLIMYHNKECILPLNKKSSLNGNLVVLNTLSLDESKRIINSGILSNKYLKGYYIDKMVKIKLPSATKKQIVQNKQIYIDLKNDCKSIIYTYPLLNQYKGKSLYYDCHIRNNLVRDNLTIGDKKKLSFYKTFYNDIFNQEDLLSYDNKYMICSIDKNIKDISSYLSNYNNFLTVIYRTISFDLNINEFPDIDIIVECLDKKYFFKFNLRSLNRSNLGKLKSLLNVMIKLENNLPLDNEESILTNEGELEYIEEIDNIDFSMDTSTLYIDKLKQDFSISKAVTGEIKTLSKIEDTVNKTSKENKKADIIEIEGELEKNQELLSHIDSLKQEKLTAVKNNTNNKRNELLRKEQREVRINKNNEKTITEIIDEYHEKSLEKEELNIPTIKNDVLKTCSLRDFEANYNKKQDEKDKLAIFESFSNENKTIPLYIRDIKKENTSTEFTKKETWTVTYEDERRLRHTFKIDVPIFIDDKFMYVEGNKKYINKQLIVLPIVKTSKDKVQVVSNYGRKAFIERFGQKVSPQIERFKKFIISEGNDKIKIELGNNTGLNNNFITNIEYDELSANYMTISVTNFKFFFNQENIREEANKLKIKIETSNDYINPIGINYKNKSIIYYDFKNNKVIDNNLNHDNISDYISELILTEYPDLTETFNSIKVGKRYQYSRASVLSKKVPLVLLLAFNIGLIPLLNKAKINYELSEKRKILSRDEVSKKGIIQFSDYYLYFDLYPYKNSLLLNALFEIPTKNYTLEEFNNKEVYLEIFYDLFGSRAISKGFDNFCELFLDPITLDVLEELDLPTDFTDLFLYANELLQDNFYCPENNMVNYRIRSNEIINAHLYKIMTDAYATYKNSANSNNPIKMTVPQDILFKELNDDKLFQNHSTLNPITESDEISQATYRGPSGLNFFHNWLTIKFFKCWNIQKSATSIIIL